MQAFADGDQLGTRNRELGQPDPSRQLAADGAVFTLATGRMVAYTDKAPNTGFWESVNSQYR